jgi:hypothetical protein
MHHLAKLSPAMTTALPRSISSVTTAPTAFDLIERNGDDDFGAIRPGSPPEVLKPIRRQLGVAHRVLDILMPEICLQAARIVAGIGQGIASAMAQHVRNVAAYPPGRVHRAVPSDKNHNTAVRQPMAARNQARWLPHHCPQDRWAGEALQPSGP